MDKSYLSFQYIVLFLFTFFAANASADIPVKATLCNHSTKPVNFELFNHNDAIAGAVPLVKKAVRACSCVSKQTHTDLWGNQPPANIIQLVFRDVGSVKGASIKVCVDGKGKFKGYVEAGVKSCFKASEEINFLPAPELTRAQGDLKVLETRMMPDTKCSENKGLGGACSKYSSTYNYIDGSKCSGNDS
ncbi:hypothetical protein [Marinicella sp. W31]|uniref:hypothetical protein n=1 Tax=Marinicella sp. W31 TaxID=3023713 RepID=UPI003757D8A8